jgi:hypothetical protein
VTFIFLSISHLLLHNFKSAGRWHGRTLDNQDARNSKDILEVQQGCRQLQGRMYQIQQGRLQQPGFDQLQRILENVVTISTAAKKIYISKVHSNSKVYPTIRLQTTAGTSATAGVLQQQECL